MTDNRTQRELELAADLAAAADTWRLYRHIGLSRPASARHLALNLTRATLKRL